MTRFCIHYMRIQKGKEAILTACEVPGESEVDAIERWRVNHPPAGGNGWYKRYVFARIDRLKVKATEMEVA